MNLTLPTACLLCFPLLGLLGTASDDGPQGQHILEAVLDRLPQEEIEIRGKLVVRKHKGVVLRELRFDMLLAWGDEPSKATYTIRDAFGAALEQLVITRSGGEEERIQYASGNPPEAAPVPPLYDSVQQTDISWADLSLSFLWWKGAQLAGKEAVRGRDCFVLDVPAPEGNAQDTRPWPPAEAPYASVRLWVDTELLVLLKAEGRGPEGGVRRRLWVKSFKKIEDRWMIRDMEVQTYPSAHRTRLRISEVHSPEPS